MTTYTATATREGNWWVLDVADVGVTQCHRLTEAREQILGLVEAVTDADVPADTEVEIHLEGILDEAIAEARRAAAEAERAQAIAATASRNTVKRLIQAGVPQSDVAVVLGVSKQRVSQLVKR